MPPPGTSASAPSTPAVLALTEGFVVDPIAEARLRRQLRRAGPEVVAVAATTGPLPPGATYRSHAARRTLADWSAVVESGEERVRGVVVARPGAVLEHRDDVVVVDTGEGRILLDEGAHVHAPWLSGGPLGPATPDACPAFARRPVVVLLGLAVDDDRARWAQTLANELVTLQVAASCAVPIDPGGFQLSRPCTPTRGSLVALCPDVVITLDERAAASAPDWLGDDRHTVIIEARTDPDLTCELVSWRLGESRGRVRARIGEAVDSGDLARLVNRLCSGPQPLPPPVSPPTPATPEDWREGMAAVLSTIRPRRRALARRFGARELVVADGSSGTGGSGRIDGLVDQLVGAGVAARRRRLDARSVDLRHADVLLLRRAAPTPDLLALVESRLHSGRLTVVDVSLADVDIRDEGATRTVALAAGPAVLVDAAGMVAVPTRAMADALDLGTARVLVLPTLVTDRLAAARPVDLEPGIRTVIGWQADATSPDELRAVAVALARVLSEHPDLSVEVVGSAAADALGEILGQSASASRSRLMKRFGHPGASWRRNLLAHVWTCAPDAVALGGELCPLVEAGLAQVPTVISGSNPATVDAAHPGALVVGSPSDPGAWSSVLLGLLDESARNARAAEVGHVASTLWGAEANALTLNRFLGWLERSRRGS